MVATGSCFFTLPERPRLDQGGPEAAVVVRLRGEHDASTERALGLTLARAIAVDGAGLVLDLSEVESMSTSTLGTILRARRFLRQRSASLTVRSPSAAARDVIDACGLTDLLCPNPEMAGGQQGTALSSWVAVPGVERDDSRPRRSAGVPAVPEHVVPARALEVHAVCVDRRDGSLA
ncbi:MAG: STAS domain-containing protein [Acidimicrobiales bacterium]